MATKKFNKVKDSGKRQKFKTGSVRDTAEGKGTPHLLAGEVLNITSTTSVLKDDLLWQIESNMYQFSILVTERDLNINLIRESIDKITTYLMNQEDGKYTGAMRRLSQHYENGAKKYDKNNWRKGQPVSRYYDSTMRHIWKEIDNEKDEDHAAAIFWNLLAILQTKIDIKKGLLPKELNDFPFLIKEVFNQNK